MNDPRNQNERTATKREQPSSNGRKREAEQDRTLPGRRSPGNEKERERVVNEDEQLKVVNNREDNAQSVNTQPEVSSRPVSRENENERLEAGDDNNEINPRQPKVN